jgi:hypothetical protein
MQSGPAGFHFLGFSDFTVWPARRDRILTANSLESRPAKLRIKYRIEEREHACAILAAHFPQQFKDILDCLTAFTLKKSYIAEQGGGPSPVSFVLGGFLSGIDPETSGQKAT